MIAPLASVQGFDEDASDELLNCSYLGQRGRREEAYTRLRSILRENEFEPPAVRAGLSQEARQLRTVRTLSDDISAARAASGG